MDEMSHRVEQTFDALQRWFGPNWTYIQGYGGSKRQL